jgi:hypothetical protein
MPYVNLNGLSMELGRVDKRKMNTAAGTKVEGMKAETQKAVMDKVNTASAELKITYMFPRPPASS